jgi:hypothetical protein
MKRESRGFGPGRLVTPWQPGWSATRQQTRSAVHRCGPTASVGRALMDPLLPSRSSRSRLLISCVWAGDPARHRLAE